MNAKRIIIITALLITSGFWCITKAQLASERPVADVLTPAMRAKLVNMPRNNRVVVRPAQLASAGGIPALPPTVAAKLQAQQTGPRPAASGEVKQEQLASNKPVAEVDKLVKDMRVKAKTRGPNKK